jgi:glycosyltransferase involved in cell wall biosynthesis
MKVSVITPASRGIEHLSHIIRDFRNQTFKDFEHIIVWDGEMPEDVEVFLKKHINDYNLKFCAIPKDPGNMRQAPGTNPRNHGIKISQGEYLIFFDDDDRCRDTYIETLISNCHDNSIGIVQMSCQQSRMYKDGDPDTIVLIPEIDLHRFPVICHVGTPCYIVKREWAIEEPWQHEPEHDFRFIKRICEKFNPIVRIIGGMQVDVDGLVLKGMRDWVSFPPFYREKNRA